MEKTYKIINCKILSKSNLDVEFDQIPADGDDEGNYTISGKIGNIAVKKAVKTDTKTVRLSFDKKILRRYENYQVSYTDKSNRTIKWELKPDITDTVKHLGNQLLDKNNGLPKSIQSVGANLNSAISISTANLGTSLSSKFDTLPDKMFAKEQLKVAQEQKKLAEDQTLFPPSPTNGGLRLAVSSSGSLQNLVEGAARQVLGVSLQKSNPRVFQTALVSSFQRQSDDRRAKYQLVAHSYVPNASDGTHKANTQAALLTLAKKNVDEALTLLKELKPLDTIGADEKRKFKSSQTIFTRQLTELGKELVREGGPCIPRANKIITELTRKFKKPIPAQIDNSDNDGITTGLGIKDNTANIVIEEQNQAAYDTIASAIDLTKTSFDAYKRNIGQSSWPANSINNLIEKLAVVAESVDGLYAALDSVQVDAEERALFDIDIQGNNLSLEDILSWTTSFVSDEAPGLLGEHDMDITIAKPSLKSTADEIEKWIVEFLRKIKEGVDISRGFTHTCVIEAGTELSNNFDALCEALK